MPLSSVSTTATASSDNNPIDVGSNRFGWPKQIELEPSESLKLEHDPNRRVESTSASQVFPDKYKGQTERPDDVIQDYFEYHEETHEQNSQFQTRNATQTNVRESTASQAKNSHSDEEIDAILKVTTLQISCSRVKLRDQPNYIKFSSSLSFTQEENDLVNAHRKLIEQTMDIVRQVRPSADTLHAPSDEYFRLNLTNSVFFFHAGDGPFGSGRQSWKPARRIYSQAKCHSFA